MFDGKAKSRSVLCVISRLGLWQFGTLLISEEVLLVEPLRALLFLSISQNEFLAATIPQAIDSTISLVGLDDAQDGGVSYAGSSLDLSKPHVEHLTHVEDVNPVFEGSATTSAAARAAWLIFVETVYWSDGIRNPFRIHQI